MIKAILNLVPIFGFELHFSQQWNQRENQQESLARPHEVGSCMGCYDCGPSREETVTGP